jgi:hypothetical protein
MDNEPEKKHAHSQGCEEIENPDMLDQPVRGARRRHDRYITSIIALVKTSRYALSMP